jgi:hypothetical protein
VAMSLITTLTFAPILARGITKNPGLMDKAASNFSQEQSGNAIKKINS